MKIAIHPSSQAFFLTICLMMMCLVSSAIEKPQTTSATISDQKEYELIKKRLHDHNGLLNATGWTFCHCADEKQVKAVEKTLNLFSAFTETNGYIKLIEAGGIQTFKANVATFLQNKDPVVRGFGAILLAVIGDEAYKIDIAKLLADKQTPPPTRQSPYS